MSVQSGAEIQFNVDGRLIVARPRPEDKDVLALLLGDGQKVTVSAASTDTEGHALASSDIAIDVEGHAMVLRLPNAGDAETLRRALGVAALTATVAVASFTAGTWQSSQPTTQVQPPAVVAPAIPSTQSAPISVNADVGIANDPATISSEEFAASRPATVAPSHAGPVVVGDDVSVGGAAGSQSGSTTTLPAQAPEAPQPAPRPFNPRGERPE
jgi:hypothetical protein